MGRIDNVHEQRFRGPGAKKVSIEQLGASPHTDGLRMSRVSFPKGTGTVWHSHAGGQLIYVVSGHCVIDERGRSPETLGEGAGWWTPPGVEHRHGAGPDEPMVHMVATLGRTNWADG